MLVANDRRDRGQQWHPDQFVETSLPNLTQEPLAGIRSGAEPVIGEPAQGVGVERLQFEPGGAVM
jgi:hypothetical protein